MKTTRKAAALALALALILSLAACGAQQSSGGLWDGASYTEDTELGEGAKTLSVEVTAEDKTITFTIHTDAENLRGALEENGLVSGDDLTLNYVGLPVETTEWNDTFTVDDYTALVKAMVDGKVTVSSDITVRPETTIAVNYNGNIK